MFRTILSPLAPVGRILLCGIFLMAGAMLFIMGAGAGPWSVDAYLEKRLKKAGK